MNWAINFQVTRIHFWLSSNKSNNKLINQSFSSSENQGLLQK